MTTPQRELYLKVRRRAGQVRRRLARIRHPHGPPQQPGRPGGRVPEAALEATHLGPVMDSAVLRAKRRMRIGVDPDYDLVQKNFDVLHYILQAPRVLERPQMDLVKQFLDSGSQHMRSPHPDFSMTDYLERYPEKANTPERSPYLEWLKRGRDAGEIADPAPAIPEMARILGLEPQGVVDRLVARRSDLQQRLLTGELGEMVARAGEIEPLIDQARLRFTRPRMLPFGHPPALVQISAIHAAHEAAGFRTARLVLVINRPRWGGGRRMEGHLVHALTSQIAPDDVVVIYTEGGGPTPEGRFPAGVREIDFASLTSKLEPEEAQHALVVLLRTFRADSIVNMNSATLYFAMRSLGKALTASERIFFCFFCNEQMPTGAWTGWSFRYFYRYFEQVAGVFTDSEYLAGQLLETYRIPGSHRDRLHVLKAPVDPGLPLATEAPTAEGRRPQVFWAGRWDRQKRIGLFLQVARMMPDVDFRMWGEPVMGRGRKQLPPNVSLQGRYSHISEIPLSEADVWLYTSGWDGVPSQLLEVAMTGVPIVGSLVGGTGEVLGEDDAWPVVDREAPGAYIEAIREVLADPAGARRRSLALRERMLQERPQKEFATQAAQLLLADDRSWNGAS